MRLTITIITIFCLLCACGNKQSNQQTEDVFEVSTVTNESENENITGEQPLIIYELITQPYPVKIQGLWGDYTYLDALKETGLVSLANEKIVEPDKELDIKIDENEILADHYYYQEPRKLYEENWEFRLYEDNSLHRINKETGSEQIYQRIKELPRTSLWNMYESEYSAISSMIWEWWSGKYTMTNKDNEESTIVEFTHKGRFNEEKENVQYSVGSYETDNFSDSQNNKMTVQDYMAFRDESSDNTSDWLWINYVMELKDGIYYLYETDEPVDMDVPFVKGKLKYTLKRQP